MRKITRLMLVLLAAAAAGCSSGGHSAAPAPGGSTPAVATASPTGAASAGAPSTDAPSAVPTTVQPSGPRPWSEVVADVRSGVVRLDASFCNGLGTGTGFLLSPTLVATVDHVVRGATFLRVTDPATSQVESGEVLGRDHAHDVALVRLAHPLDGHIFTLAPAQPELATEMAILGYQRGGALQSSTGAVTKQHDRRTVGGGNDTYQLSDQLLTDAAQNPGNSGGPWIDRDGQVLALAESGPPYDADQVPAQGNNGGVPSTVASPIFDAFEAAGAPVPLAHCVDPSREQVTAEQQAETTVFQYFYDLSVTDFDSAFAQLDPANHPPTQRARFLADVESSQDSDPGDPMSPVGILNTGRVGADTFVDVEFLSHQDVGKGPADAPAQTCTHWTLRYHTVPVLGVRLIHRSQPLPGTSGHRACSAP